MDHIRDDLSELSNESNHKHSHQPDHFLKNSWNILKDDQEDHQREKVPLQRLSLYSNPNINSKRSSLFINMLDLHKEGESIANSRWNLNSEEQENFNLLVGDVKKNYEVVSTTQEPQKRHLSHQENIT